MMKNQNSFTTANHRGSDYTGNLDDFLGKEAPTDPSENTPK